MGDQVEGIFKRERNRYKGDEKRDRERRCVMGED